MSVTPRSRAPTRAGHGDDGTRYLSHEGAFDGYLSLIMVVPGSDLGLVILTNSEDAASALISAARSFCSTPGSSHRPGWRSCRLSVPSVSPVNSTEEATTSWPDRVFDRLKTAGVQHVGYVPDAGHSTLISLSIDDPDITTTMLTSEEEGVAVATGAWLGGMRSALLMQSSGVGNCINMLSLPVQTRTPLLMIVTMRGEWAEFNPWQVPMSRATEPSLTAIGLQTVRASTGEEVVSAVAQGATMAYESDQQVAVLISQQLLGEKTW